MEEAQEHRRFTGALDLHQQPQQNLHPTTDFFTHRWQPVTVCTNTHTHFHRNNTNTCREGLGTWRPA